MDEKSCAMCGATEDLIEDPNVEGVFHCRVCLDRSRKQDSSIEDGMDEEPPVEY